MREKCWKQEACSLWLTLYSESFPTPAGRMALPELGHPMGIPSFLLNLSLIPALRLRGTSAAQRSLLFFFSWDVIPKIQGEHSLSSSWDISMLCFSLLSLRACPGQKLSAGNKSAEFTAICAAPLVLKSNQFHLQGFGVYPEEPKMQRQSIKPSV